MKNPPGRSVSHQLITNHAAISIHPRARDRASKAFCLATRPSVGGKVKVPAPRRVDARTELSASRSPADGDSS